MTSPSFKYAGSDEIGLVAWYTENSDPDGSGKKNQPVGLKLPNELGLFDMSGNVWEWCYDRKGPYTSDPQTNPIGPETGPYRIYRGGAWDSQKEVCQVGKRAWSNTDGLNRLGFRLARTAF